MTYDTAEIRAAARKIQRCAQQVSNEAEPTLRSIRSDVDSSFRGLAADAFAERLKDIDADVKTISGGLNALYRTLMRFADALDEADRKIADML